MGLRINTNVASLGVGRRLFATQERLNRSMARLASGLRIATARDDAAGLAVSERMRARTRSLAAAERNVLDGIGLAAAADGAIEVLHDHVARVRELALRSLNDPLSPEDRRALSAEYDQVVAEMDRLVADTEFNGLPLLRTSGAIDIQAGADAGDSIRIRTRNLRAFPRILRFFDLDTDRGARRAMRIADRAAEVFSSVRGQFGAAQLRLESALRSTAAAREGLTAAESRIRDVDVAAEAAELARHQILQHAGVAVLAQANLQPAVALLLLPPVSDPARGGDGSPDEPPGAPPVRAG